MKKKELLNGIRKKYFLSLLKIVFRDNSNKLKLKKVKGKF